MSFIELLKYIFLGIIQGVTEVLPISSSGHVAIFQQILNIRANEGMLFLILVNLGSFVAIVIHFRRLIGKLIKAFFGYLFANKTDEESAEGFRYVIKIIIATIPAGIIGYIAATTIDSLYQDHYLIIVGTGLLLTATALFIVRNAAFVNGRQTVTYKDAMFMGVLQSLAIFPGLSRSGITASAGLTRKMSMETTLNFSFMMYIPISIGSVIKYLSVLIADPNSELLSINWAQPTQMIYYGAAMIASIIATRFALKFMYRLFREGRLMGFSAYTFFLGTIALVTGIIIA